MSMLAKKRKSGPPRSAIYSCLHTSLRARARQGPRIILRTQTSVVSNLRRVPRHRRGGGEALGHSALYHLALGTLSRPPPTPWLKERSRFPFNNNIIINGLVNSDSNFEGTFLAF